MGELPSWLDVGMTRAFAVGLAVFAVVCLVAVMFTVRSLATRVVVIVVLGAAVFGLLHYRSELDHCDKSGCACKLFGQDVEGGGCNRG